MANIMNQQISFSNTSVNKTINPEQFDQVVEAILAGKYSWACVLLLRFAGYNPLQYIPYRTYNRLLKENCQIGNQSRHQTDIVSTDNKRSETKSDGRISDLGYLEVVGEQDPQIRGGNLDNLDQGLDSKIPEYNSLKVELIRHKNQGFPVRIW